MVAVIRPGKSLRGTLNYNEQKVKQHKAECLTAVNYPKKADELNFYQKLNRLTNLAALRPRSQVNSVHISLNFDPSEKLNNGKMELIAIDYMQRIGFGDQPYLIYRHNDSGHPHLHIVTTNIQADGKRIELHNIGKNISEPARKQIEEDYRLVKASSKAIRETVKIPAVDAHKVIYGQTETKRAITNVLDKIVDQYKYTSLSELNAVLLPYNVRAERGQEDSRLYKSCGLLYRVLDPNGTPVGVPIKASSIYNKPTLKILTEKFAKNAEDRKKYKQRVKTTIDWALYNNSLTLKQLTAALKKEGIHVVLRENKDGRLYGITYVDHKTKCVFNGSDIGKEYSAEGITARCSPPDAKRYQTELTRLQSHQQNPDSDIIPNTSDISRVLLTPTGSDNPPGDLRYDRKKRKKKRLKL